MDEILTLIGNYVFPIAMCILVWFQSTKSQEKLIDKVTELFNKVTELIQANTQAMTANAKALEDLRETIERKVD